MNFKRLRGGAWCDIYLRSRRCTDRHRVSSIYRDDHLGFRIVSLPFFMIKGKVRK